MNEMLKSTVAKSAVVAAVAVTVTVAVAVAGTVAVAVASTVNRRNGRKGAKTPNGEGGG